MSYGDPQTVAVTARRSLKNLTLHYSINGRKPVAAPVHEWTGGERYGDTGDRYYAEFRGKVHGANVGDDVKVWFTGQNATTVVTSAGRPGTASTSPTRWRKTERAMCWSSPTRTTRVSTRPTRAR